MTTQAIDHLGASIMFLMLRLCINTRPVYFLRSAVPEHTAQFASDFDQVINAALARLSDMGENPLPELSKEVRTLPTKLGGLSLRSLSHIRESAYYASWLKSLKYIYEQLPFFYGFGRLSTFNKQFLENAHLEHLPQTESTSFQDIIHPMISSGRVFQTQKELTKSADEALYKKVLTTYTPINREAIGILVSQATEGISSWLFSALYYDNKVLRLEDTDFQESLRIRLLLPTHSEGTVLPRCESCNLDHPSLYHGYTCRKVAGAYKGRHDRVCRALLSFAKSVTTTGVIDVNLEENVSLPPIGDEICRADIVLKWGNRTHYVDVRVCSCTSKTSLNSRRGDPNVPPEVGLAIRQGESSKYSKYVGCHGELIRNQLTPFVLDMTGRLGPKADEFIKKLSKLFDGHHDAITISDEKLKSARQFFMRRLGIALAAGNGHLVRQYRGFVNMNL